MDFLSADSLPWLSGSQRRMRASLIAKRLPQALLTLSVPGLGAEQLAYWIAALVLCESQDAPPCGACPACVLLRADSHPDLHAVRLAEDAQQVKVDQIRALTETLSLSSYRGGHKVAIVENAETLNANGANAFLKTLEEPTANTLLMLIAKPSHRLPATIASRCQRLNLKAPSREEAGAWLKERDPKVLDWNAALTLAAGAPLLALELQPAATLDLDREMRTTLKRLVDGACDVTTVADAWMKSDPGLRLMWLENWITRRVQVQLGGAVSSQSAEPVRLPAALLKPKIRPLFELLDAARELRGFAATGLNQQLALEALLLGGRAALFKALREVEAK
jgi:DNA polymerase-3 subunit delta'